jgi:maltose alpha-D-glucosyltransferase/alpha-amylase
VINLKPPLAALAIALSSQAALAATGPSLDVSGDIRLRGEQLETLAEGDSVKVQIHGDYHLGQVLRAEQDAPEGNEWYVIDFEGEPARALEERRAKVSVLRVVAGMLRSFDYAVRVSLNAFAVQDLRVRLAVERWAAAWLAEVRTLFLEAYRRALGTSPVVPRDPEALSRALAVFELEKAIYELGYEMNNRPDWIGVPLQGVLAILGEDGA